jgi:hypothetical protein
MIYDSGNLRNAARTEISKTLASATMCNAAKIYAIR